jgi:hypothetical protein
MGAGAGNRDDSLSDGKRIILPRRHHPRTRRNSNSTRPHRQNLIIHPRRRHTRSCTTLARAPNSACSAPHTAVPAGRRVLSVRAARRVQRRRVDGVAALVAGIGAPAGRAGFCAGETWREGVSCVLRLGWGMGVAGRGGGKYKLPFPGGCGVLSASCGGMVRGIRRGRGARGAGGAW